MTEATMAHAKKLLFLALILLTLPAGVCDGPGVTDPYDPDDPLDAYGWLGGQVTIDGEPATQIELTLTGDDPHVSPRTTRTTLEGVYYFDDLFAGTYTVTISTVPPDVEFDPLSQTVGVSGNTYGVDFQGFRRVAHPVSVDVLIFGRLAYPTAKFIEGGAEAGCAEAHWHSRSPVPAIAKEDRSRTGFNCLAPLESFKSDRAPHGCGHGTVEEVQRDTITLGQSCLDDYVDEYGPPAP
jgi:hypothetical protein